MSDIPNPLGVDVDAYIRSIPKGTLSDDEFTLIAGNLRTFYHHVTKHALPTTEQPQGQIGATGNQQTENEQCVDEAITFLESMAEEDWAEAVRELRDKAKSPHPQPNAVKLAIECLKNYRNETVHTGECSLIKSSRRRSGRIEPCSCGLESRQNTITEALTALSESSETRDGEIVDWFEQLDKRPVVVNELGINVRAIEFTWNSQKQSLREAALAAMRNDGGAV